MKTTDDASEIGKKIQPKEIVSKYTVISSSEIEANVRGFYSKRVTIQDWFKTAQEAHEWESKVKQFILENKNDNN